MRLTYSWNCLFSNNNKEEYVYIKFSNKSTKSDGRHSPFTFLSAEWGVGLVIKISSIKNKKSHIACQSCGLIYAILGYMHIIRILKLQRFRDASQTCKSWYAAFINSHKIQNNVEFVIHRKHSEALMALSRHPSRCKRITIEVMNYISNFYL